MTGRCWLGIAAASVLAIASARADTDPDLAPDELAPPVVEVTGKRIVGFRVEGTSKLSHQTLQFLTRTWVGDVVTDAQLPELEAALVSSELFKSVQVRYEDVDDGVIVVATLEDKHSWIVMPTIYVLSRNWAVGMGFAENNLFGENRKFLVYGQIGDLNSFFVGAYVIPAYRGTRLSFRFDTFLQQRRDVEYLNPPDDPSSTELARISTQRFLNAGAAVGYNHRWWLNTEARLRGALVAYLDPHVPGDPTMALPPPSPDGLDITTQFRVTVDRRTHAWGVSEGLYTQLMFELPALGLTDYKYLSLSVRLWHSWRLFREHQFEIRSWGDLSYQIPIHTESTLGAASDLRGYLTEQFRGDTRALARAEYSVPLWRWRIFSFRSLVFYDTGYIGFHFPGYANRNYLPGQVGRGYWRTDAGGGFRVYVRNIVLPLLGFDIGRGFENRATQIYFQVGLTNL
jgi:outer membrane protein insertion porin family